MPEADTHTTSELLHNCSVCGAAMVHLGIIRRFQRSTISVFRCYGCNNVLVEQM